MFIHLHTHSEYSKDAISKVEEIAEAHLEMGTTSFCITDHGTMSSFPTAFKVAKELDMKFIPGIEIYLKPPVKYDSKESNLVKAELLRKVKLKKIDPEVKEQAKKDLAEIEKIDTRRNFHMTVLAKNQVGLENMFKMYSEGDFYYSHRISEESLFKNREGIIVLSGCLGSELCYYVMSNKMDEADALIQKYKAMFKDDYYIEIMHHGVIDTREKEKGYLDEVSVYRNLIMLAKKHGVKTVVTNDSHHVKREDSKLHRLYTNLVYDKEEKTKTEASEIKGDPGRGYDIIPEKLVKNRFIAAGYDEEDIDNMIESVHEIEAKVSSEIDLKSPPPLRDVEPELRELLSIGWKKKREGTEYAEQSLKQIEHELEVITSKNFTEYFTNMHLIVARAHEIGLLTGPGRGSAAGSEIAYLLDITKTDPIRFGLIFERFLNPSRNQMPDIDLDIMSKLEGDSRLGSEILTDSLKDKFEFSGRINNIVKASTLTLFKSLCKYYGVLFTVSNKITTNQIGVDMFARDECPSEEEFKDIIRGILGYRDNNWYNRQWKNVYDNLGLAYRLDKVVSGTSIHASGVIMTEKVLPLPLDTKNIIDFNGSALEHYSYIKYDLLSLEALNPIKDIFGLDIDWEDTYDPKVYESIGNGELDFVFQLSGGVPRAMATQGKPTSIEDLSDISAINRPGPLNMKLNTKWVDIRKGTYKPTHIEDTIAKILKKAFGESHSGLLVYQEDVMRFLVESAGFSMAESENIRRAMGKKDEKIMAKYKEHFLVGWEENEYDDDGEEIWDIILQFAKYGFNKSHSVSYSLISYKNAEMWVYHKKEYLEWIINNLPKQRQNGLTVAKKEGFKVVFPTYREAIKRDSFKIIDDNIYPPANIDLNFETVSEFIFSDISKVDKNIMIINGAIDEMSYDRKALSEIIKNIPDKRLVNPGFPPTSDLASFLYNATLLDLLSFEDKGDHYLITVNKARSKIDIELHKNNSLTDDKIKSMIKNDLAKYGVIKQNLLSFYPSVDKDKVLKFYMILKKRIDNLISTGGMTEEKAIKLQASLKHEYREALRSHRIQKLKKELESPFKCYIIESKYMSNYNQTIVRAMFGNGEYRFYVRERHIINELQSVSKGDVIKLMLKFDSYINKNGDPIFQYKIDGVV